MNMQPWMKTTALLLIGALLGVAGTSLVFHRYGRPHHPGAADTDRILKHLSSKLDLTADQKEKTATLLKLELPKADALREEGDKKFKALRESFNTQFRPLLNTDQQKKYDEMVAQHQKREAQGDHPFGCSGPSMANPGPPSQAVPAK
jgi:hypothetical protein